MRKSSSYRCHNTTGRSEHWERILRMVWYSMIRPKCEVNGRVLGDGHWQGGWPLMMGLLECHARVCTTVGTLVWSAHKVLGQQRSHDQIFVLDKKITGEHPIGTKLEWENIIWKTTAGMKKQGFGPSVTVGMKGTRQMRAFPRFKLASLRDEVMVVKERE